MQQSSNGVIGVSETKYSEARLGRAVAGSRRPHTLCCDSGDVYWLEDRPDQGGQVMLLRLRDGRIEDLLPDGESCRSRVHEYGGGAYAVFDAVVYWVNQRDQQIYRIGADGQSTQLSAVPNTRFADFSWQRSSGKLVCVAERHEHGKVLNQLVSIDTSNGQMQVLFADADFYAAPRISADDAQLVFLSWNHPDMPWQRTQISLASIDAALNIQQLQSIGEKDCAYCNPHWAADGALMVISDQDNWWKPWRKEETGFVSLLDDKAEYGRPMWQLGMSRLANSADGLIAIRSQQGYEDLQLIDRNNGTRSALQTGLCSFESVATMGEAIYMIAADESSGFAVYRMEGSHCVRIYPLLASMNQTRVSPEAISFASTHNSEAHGFFYPPKHPRWSPPPLIVVMHGGPTTQAKPHLNPLIQYWCAEGFAVLDVNYRGSTGYGRDYRLALAEQWGVFDVDDCVAGAQYLAGLAKVDPKRMVIRGGSAGGFTALAAVCFSDTFAAAGVHYGICDLSLLAAQTHKFESRYLDHLIGPWPEAKQRYQQRSPLAHLDQLQNPVFFSHGKRDQVVPLNQAQLMHAALLDKGVETELLVFDDEAHGYRDGANLRRLLRAEIEFYKRVLV